MHFKRFVSIVSVVTLLWPLVAVAAVRGHDSMYVGGTVGIAQKTKGRLDVTSPIGITFTTKDGGQVLLNIPYEQVTAAEYGEHAGRRVGATIALGITTLGLGALPVLFSKKKRHYLTIYFNKDAKIATVERATLAKDPTATAKGDVAIFEVNKHDYANVITEIEAKTGIKVQLEAEKR